MIVETRIHLFIQLIFTVQGEQMLSREYRCTPSLGPCGSTTANCGPCAPEQPMVSISHE